MQSIFMKVARLYKVEWTPRLLDVAGFACIVGAVALLLGFAPALAATGVALLICGWAVSS